MGDISEAIIEGEMCCYCGCFLDPNEVVYGQSDDRYYEMPTSGEGIGFPVYCESCKNEK